MLAEQMGSNLTLAHGFRGHHSLVAAKLLRTDCVQRLDHVVFQPNCAVFVICALRIADHARSTEAAHRLRHVKFVGTPDLG